MRLGCQIGMWKGGGLEEVVAAVGKLGADDAGGIRGARGIRGIEVFTTHLEPYRHEPAKLARILDSAGVKLSGAYFNSKGFIDPAEEDSVVAEAAGFCDILRDVGGGFLVANGGVAKGDPPRSFSDDDFRQLAKVLGRIGSAAGERGVAAVVHPHVRCMVETPADVDLLVAAGLERERVGLCVHASHQLHAGADPYEIYEKHASWVRYSHVGDVREGKGSLLGEGEIDQERLMRPLLEAGFDGWIIAECGEKGVTPEEYATKAAAYVRKTWPGMRWDE